MPSFLLRDTSAAMSSAYGGILELLYKETAPGVSFCLGCANAYHLCYILHGCGNVGSKPMQAGQGCLLPPGISMECTSDAHNPIRYLCLSLCGQQAIFLLLSAGFDLHHTTFNYTYQESLEIWCHCLTSTGNSSFIKQDFLQGFFRILSSYHRADVNFAKISIKKQHVSRALAFIQEQYGNNIRVSDVSAHLALNSQYLHHIFMEILHVSPKTYITQYRLEQAKHLLLDSCLSIGDIANSVGYADVFAFSRIFKKYVGTSPETYRKAK